MILQNKKRKEKKRKRALKYLELYFSKYINIHVNGFVNKKYLYGALTVLDIRKRSKCFPID